jgi:HD-like signal output (HDOD) protein
VRKILFVDDEPKLLEGLRRMLRGLRHEWHTEFVQSGQEALDCLAARPFDVVVTDMRMPGMDGAQLLEEVMQRSPGTIRIVLSGQCDRETVLKAVGGAHQFLTKPCDSEAVKGAVTRTCGLRDQLADDGQKQIVSRVQWIASSARTYAELARELASEAPSPERIGQIVEGDVGMTAKLLQLVSSSFFGPPQEVVKAAEAAGLLGVELLKSLMFSARVFRARQDDSPAARFVEALREHSLAVADGARRIAWAETAHPAAASQAYTAGLLHDIGFLLPAEGDPREHGGFLAPEGAWAHAAGAADQNDLARTHAGLGGYLLGLWGLSQTTVDAAVFHHAPRRSSETAFSPLAAVHFAEAVASAPGGGLRQMATSLDMEYLARIGCADRIERWYALCQAPQSEGMLP